MNTLHASIRLLFFFGFTTTFTLRAAIIPVTNGSFESPDTGSYINEATGWIHSSARIAVQKTSGVFPTAPDGDQWLVVDSRSVPSTNEPGYIFQNIGTIDESLIYTLDVVIGSRSDNSLPSNFVGGFFTDDDGVFSGGSGVGVSLDADGSLATFDKGDYSTLPDATKGTLNGQVSWDAAGSGLQGEDLYIGFYIPNVNNSGNNVQQVLFDNVVVTAVPEPTSLILMIGGLLSMLAFRKRMH
ncbi:PEP-CTERM sorting domain-containing protein [Kiritimatiellaeota bacterium B1221]|nr:PEP-CTERM sorting domain-containing protein [Kiritimatiellaeota bacterium B1221]